ncbi:PhnB protein [Stackebrandtia endophytica]|uniref:PhnB protein n=1 Tax=Stackebrandtia endophytica TaxID=1496996 RepID=A0A543APV6_9ACTN|nr:VOC family protein [Stackebrandtia endophytica]TQL74613.1 PhnB protein [Stackebrandtia endophytica]
MSMRLNPYISFNGDAKTAMQFYQGVLGGELTMSTFGEFGAPGPDENKIMHSSLETDAGFTLMASDVPQGMEHHPGDNITIAITGDDADKLRTYWEKLSDGGTVSMPLEKQIWGDVYGACVDRFGINWMIDIGESD